MPSTYTGAGIELIGAGEQSGSWGDTTNTNLEIIDRLTSQAGTIALSGTTHTLSLSDGTLSDGQYAVLVFAGSPSGTNTVTISPNDAKRVFIVKNDSGQSVVLTQGSGGNVTIADGKSVIAYCDGAGSGAAVVNVSAGLVSGTLDAIGALTPTDGNFIVGNGSTWVAESGNTVLTSIGVTATTTELNTLDGVTASTAEINTLDGINTAGNFGYVPSGGIILWSGAVAAIPSGWLLCDGTNGTPNLTDRFVVGAGTSYAVGATGGAANVTLTTSQIPGHTHTFSDSGNTGNGGAHGHNLRVADNDSGTGTGNYIAGETNRAAIRISSGYNYTATESVVDVGNHNHSFSVSGTTSSTGGGNSHENRPPYYALAYIMKA